MVQDVFSTGPWFIRFSTLSPSSWIITSTLGLHILTQSPSASQAHEHTSSSWDLNRRPFGTLAFLSFFFLSQIRALIFPMDYYFQIYIVYFKMRARASPCSANSYDGIPSICFQTLNHHLHLKVKAKLNRLTPFLCQCSVYC